MIHKLSNEVINRIAAGQVVQRPYNAIKQLFQNSIDAGANQIHLNIQNGGLKLIQIRDNGRGISVHDFHLLCQRYATSKLQKITDLQSIQSFGFRGQALASLSHVGDVQVISRHQKCHQGYKAKFQRQKLIGEPLATKRAIGTTIIVQNLFSSLSSRRKSLSPLQQKKSIKQLLYQISLRYPHIQISLSSQKGQQLFLNNSQYTIEQSMIRVFCQLTGMIKQNCIFGRTQINGTKVIAIFSKLNTYDKWRNIITTVNNRIVQSTEIFKVLEKAYDDANQTIHKQNYSYCSYIQIQIDPHKIDCNVHPTKKQVQFFKGGDLFYQLLKWIGKQLQNSGTIKHIDSQCRLSQHAFIQVQSKFKQKILSSQQPHYQLNRLSSQMIQNQSLKTDYAFNKTRTDSKQLPLQYFYKLSAEINDPSQKSNINSLQKMQGSQRKLDKFIVKDFQQYFENKKLSDQSLSIKSFLLKVTYVGCFNSSYIFIQIQNKLFCFQIYHLTKVFINQKIKQTQSFFIKYLHSALSIPSLIQNFLLKNITTIGQNKMQRIYHRTLSQLSFSKELLWDNYGIKINQFMELQAFPIVDKVFQQQQLREDSLAYFFVQAFATTQLDYKQKTFHVYVMFLASTFLNHSHNSQMSPHTDKYDHFFKNQFIPTLKMKGKFYDEQFQNLKISDLLSQMMDLKDAYKMFQRC